MSIPWTSDRTQETDHGPDGTVHAALSGLELSSSSSPSRILDATPTLTADSQSRCPSPSHVNKDNQEVQNPVSKTRKNRKKRKKGARRGGESEPSTPSRPGSQTPHRTPISQIHVPNPSSQSLGQSDLKISNYSQDTGDRGVDIALGRLELVEGDSRTNQVREGILSGAHGFVMNNPTFIDNKIPLAGQSDYSPALQWVEGYIMEGAEFDAAERVPPPRCHPGTRTSIIERTSEWIDNPEREKRLLWLRGPAGVGKSAIVQTVAEALSKSGKLGASLFFSRPNGRSNPQQVFPTIAYQLALRDASYKAYINELMLSNPRSLKKSMEEQFRVLITEPFAQRKLCSNQGVLLVAIDGLDECDGDPIHVGSGQSLRCGRTLEGAQREIVQLISDFVQRYPLVSLIWIIASRPENHLKATFAATSVRDSFVEEDIPVDSDEACRDVERYLHASFTKIQEDYPDHIYETPWPSHAQFLKIAKAALGLFVFAEVVIRFIDDPRVGNPIAQLKYVLSAIVKLQISPSTNPLEVLDAIYTAILDRVPQGVIANTKSLLHMTLSFQYKIKVTDFTFCDMYNYCAISRDDAITALRHLHSVVFFPKAKVIDKSRPCFYHASFGDYLKDPLRSGEYTILGTNIDASRLVEVFLPQSIGTSENFTHREGSHRLLVQILRGKTLLSPNGLAIDLLGIRCNISDQQLQTIFSHFDISELLRSPDGLWFVHNYLPLQEEHTLWAIELKRRGCLRITNLSAISAPPSGLCYVVGHDRHDFVALHRQSYGIAGITCASGHYGDLFRNELRRLYVESPKTKILLWGSRVGKQCAVICSKDLPTWWDAANRKTVYLCGFSEL